MVSYCIYNWESIKQDSESSAEQIETKTLATDKKVIITFVDFKKPYDSIDRDTLIEVLKEFGIGDKTIALI